VTQLRAGLGYACCLTPAPPRGTPPGAQVNDALKEEMKTIHALSIKKAVPPAAA
jgi:hypothetical protein